MRLRFPEVRELATTRQLASVLAGAALAAVLHEDGAEPLAGAALPGGGDIVLVVGPEGGVSPEELAAFAEAGARPYRLGSSVLRTSTAGVAHAAPCCWAAPAAGAERAGRRTDRSSPGGSFPGGSSPVGGGLRETGGAPPRRVRRVRL